MMNGRYLYLSVKAICNNTHSERVAKPTTYPGIPFYSPLPLIRLILFQSLITVEQTKKKKKKNECRLKRSEPYMDFSVASVFVCSLRCEHVSLFFPELVRNLSCYVHSSKQTRCSWLPVSDAADLGFFFRYVCRFFLIVYLNPHSKLGHREVVPQIRSSLRVR